MTPSSVALMGLAVILLLLVDRAHADCASTPPGLPAAFVTGFTNDNGCSSNVQDSEPDGRVCTVACQDGYGNNDNLTPLWKYRCTGSTWVVMNPSSCIPSLCQFPFLDSMSGRSYGDCKTFRRTGQSCALGCAMGFTARQGTDGTITCTADGPHSSHFVEATPALICDPSPCPTAPSVPNSNGVTGCSTNEGGEYDHGTTCDIACVDGYAASGSFTCMSGIFVPNNNPTCTAATCTTPDVSADPLKTTGACGQNAPVTTGQQCNLGCVSGYQSNPVATITCQADLGAPTASFSPLSYECDDINECAIAYPLACGVGWDCANNAGSFTCAPVAPTQDFVLGAEEFFRGYRSRRHDGEGEHGGEGEGPSPRYRYGEGEGRGGHGGGEGDRRERRHANHEAEWKEDDDTHVFVGLKWALGAPTMVQKLELEVKDGSDVFSLKFNNPNAKHAVFKAKRDTCYQFTLVVTTEKEGEQRSPELTVNTPPVVTNT